MASVSGTLPALVDGRRLSVVALAAGAPVLLLLARLLPAEGGGLALRLAAASTCVLLVPGALLLRAFAWPRSFALAVSGSLALSLALLFLAFALTFAADATLTVTLALVSAGALAALVPALRAKAAESDRRELLVAMLVLASGLIFAALVWWSAAALGTGDVLFHLARIRKLAEADVLSSVAVANEFRDGGLHPGYAFPLWHGAVALVARLAGVDASLAVLHLPAILSPLAFLVAYAAGAALFRSWAGGVAALAAQVAQLGFAGSGTTGSFASLSLPSSITRVVLVPALLALAFAFWHTGSRRLLVPLAAAALAVAVVHPTYLVFAVIPLAGFALVWLALRRSRTDVARAGAMFSAVLLPAGLFLLWLLSVVTSTVSHSPSPAEKQRALAHYGDQVQLVGETYRAAPEAITRTGAAVVAGLAVLPLLGLAGRRVWALFALGGSLLVLAILLLPELFTRFSDLVSLSQSRRLAQFLPIPFALAGAAVVLGRFRLAAILVALTAGIVLQRLYPGEFTHEVAEGGPIWPLWLAVAGGSLALVSAIVLGRRTELVRADATAWTAAVALAFVLPIAVSAVADLERAKQRDPDALTPGVVGALRRLESTDVVYAPVETSYRAAAFASVYIAASPPPHVANTEANRPYRRQRDARRFFLPRSGLSESERRRLLARYGADWLLVDKRRPYPRRLIADWPQAYEDGRYALLRVPTG